jgi:SAM-dependent methyltransferase
MKENKEYFASRFIFDKGRSVVWRAINEYLANFIPKNASILDLGCGYGDFINGISAKEKWAIDLNMDVQDYLRDDVHFKAQSVLDAYTDIAPSSLDLVFASNLFEHFDDNELSVMIANIKQVLKSGGKLMLMQPNIYYA